MPMEIMEDGFSTTINFGQTEATFCARTITPPAMIMGGANDVSCMSNTKYRTKAAKRLIDLGDVTAVGFYNGSLYTSFVDTLGTNQQITITVPPIGNATTSSGTLSFFGFLDSFTPSAHEEGSAPEATVVIVVTNRDLNGDESDPVFTAGGGS